MNIEDLSPELRQEYDRAKGSPFGLATFRLRHGCYVHAPVAPKPAPTPAQQQLASEIAANDAREQAELSAIPDPMNRAAFRREHPRTYNK